MRRRQIRGPLLSLRPLLSQKGRVRGMQPRSWKAPRPSQEGDAGGFHWYSARVRGYGRRPAWICRPDRPGMSGRRPAARKARARGWLAVRLNAAPCSVDGRSRHDRLVVTARQRAADGGARMKTPPRDCGRLNSARTSLMNGAPHGIHAVARGTVRARSAKPCSPGACRDPLPFNGPVPSVPEAPGLPEATPRQRP
jgi:hypothetical protein